MASCRGALTLRPGVASAAQCPTAAVARTTLSSAICARMVSCRFLPTGLSGKLVQVCAFGYTGQQNALQAVASGRRCIGRPACKAPLFNRLPVATKRQTHTLVAGYWLNPAINACSPCSIQHCIRCARGTEATRMRVQAAEGPALLASLNKVPLTCANPLPPQLRPRCHRGPPQRVGSVHRMRGWVYSG